MKHINNSNSYFQKTSKRKEKSKNEEKSPKKSSGTHPGVRRKVIKGEKSKIYEICIKLIEDGYLLKLSEQATTVNVKCLNRYYHCC